MNFSKLEGIATREDMKSFLQRYHIGEVRGHMVEERRHRIIGELRAAYPSPAPMIDEIEARFIAQKREADLMMLQVVELIEQLPDSIERTILELRHIHCLSWKEITSALYISSTNAYTHYNAALDQLLRNFFPAVPSE